MDSYFNKINIDIYYPDFDFGYDNKISRIQYQVTYPDLNGSPTSRVECWIDTGNNGATQPLQLAAWSPSLKYNYMRFSFLKNDKPDANVIIKRTIYYLPGMQESSAISEVSISTKSNDANSFKVIERSITISVQNKIVITIGELGVDSKSSDVFETTF